MGVYRCFECMDEDEQCPACAEADARAEARVANMFTQEDIDRMVRNAEAHARALGVIPDESDRTEWEYLFPDEAAAESEPTTIPVRLDLADHLVDALLAVGNHAAAEELRAAVKEAKG